MNIIQADIEPTHNGHPATDTGHPATDTRQPTTDIGQPTTDNGQQTTDNGQQTPDNAKYCYRYPHPAVTADCVIFGFNGKGIKILLVERGNEPYLGYWALPGGFMRMDESIEQTAARELHEETNLSEVFLEQFRVYSSPDRDPRERVITVAFIALVKPDDYNVLAGDDAAKAMWFDESMLPPLAFDHRQIIREAREYLKEILRLKPVAFQLLNKIFTISELQTVYEVINQTSYDRRNFLRTAIDSEVIAEVPTPEASLKGRNIRLYTTNDEILTPHPECQPTKPAREVALHTVKQDLCLNTNASMQDDDEESYDVSGPDLKNSAPRKAPTKGLFDFLSFRHKR